MVPYATWGADADRASETKEGNVGEIVRDITIEGDIPEDARARLMEIADKCPVHQTLTHEIKIRSRLVPRDEHGA